MHENFNKKVYKGEASNTMDISPSTTRIMVKVGEEEAIIINLATQEEDLQIEVVGTIGTQINSSGPQCQVCEKLSHVAFDSWHSFGQDFNIVSIKIHTILPLCQQWYLLPIQPLIPPGILTQGPPITCLITKAIKTHTIHPICQQWYLLPIQPLIPPGIPTQGPPIT